MDLLRSWSAWCYTEKRKFKQVKNSTDDRNILMERDESVCCLCGKMVEHNLRVIHHCHLTGEFFGVAHSKCNLRAKATRFLPVFFHNLSRYDAHHIIKYLKVNDGEKLSAIAKNNETYIFFFGYTDGMFQKQFRTKRCALSFTEVLDSFQFMSQSLESLAKTVDKNGFKLLRAGFPNIGDDLFQRLTKKGFFPYNYLDSFEKFNEPFPPHGPLWYNTLTKAIAITKEQHNFALEVYNAFNCENLGD